MGRALTAVIGVYHADGGPVGEAKYVIGKLLGRAHCALCDITHALVHRKLAWDRMAAQLGTEVQLLHLNEMPDDVAALVDKHGSPVVLGRSGEGTLSVLLTADALERMDGSVAAFDAALRAAAARVGAPL
jgi:hypothetical protein